MAAPNRNFSGSSQSLTLREFEVKRVGREEVVGSASRRDGVNTVFYAIDGTPAACVHVAVTHLANRQRFDLVVSGINHGQNIGVDTHMSGTVGAARMARDLGLPSVALSLDLRSEEYRGAAARASDLIKEILRVLQASKTRVPILLNVNFPDGQPANWKPPRLAKLGSSAYSIRYRSGRRTTGAVVLEPKISLSKRPLVENTDRWALERGHITVTPLAPGRWDDGGEAVVKKLDFFASK